MTGLSGEEHLPFRGQKPRSRPRLEVGGPSALTGQRESAFTHLNVGSFTDLNVSNCSIMKCDYVPFVLFFCGCR